MHRSRFIQRNNPGPANAGLFVGVGCAVDSPAAPDEWPVELRGAGMSNLDLWKELIAESLCEHGVKATSEQIALIASDAQGIAESISEHSFHPADPAIRELAESQAALKREKDKVICSPCKGSGSIYTAGPHHGSTSQCWKCRGEGRHAP